MALSSPWMKKRRQWRPRSAGWPPWKTGQGWWYLPRHWPAESWWVPGPLLTWGGLLSGPRSLPLWGCGVSLRLLQTIGCCEVGVKSECLCRIMERLASLCTSEPVVWGDLQSEPASWAERVCWGECRAFSLLAEQVCILTHTVHTQTHTYSLTISVRRKGQRNVCSEFCRGCIKWDPVSSECVCVLVHAQVCMCVFGGLLKVLLVSSARHNFQKSHPMCSESCPW